jgi:hypothetical protein
MRVKVSGLMTKVRLRVSDMQRTRYSDYQILSALNDAMKMLWIALAEHFSSIPRVTRKISLIFGTAALPENYYSLVSISDGARVDGFVIRGAGSDTVTLVYNAIPPELTLEAGDIAFSDDDIACEDTDPLVPGYALLSPAVALDMTEITAAIIRDDMDGAAAVAKSSAYRISQQREYAGIPDWTPFS